MQLRLLNPGGEGEQWLPESFTVLDPGKDVDIVVLVARGPILSDAPPGPPLGSPGAVFGGDCEFLGFPYGGGWRAKVAGGKEIWMPFVKHCTISALASAGSQMWVLDGINNAGFSGGPVIFGTGNQQKIMAVISGYHTEPVEVVPANSINTVPRHKSNPRKEAVPRSGGQTQPQTHSKEKVEVNSGFIVAYDIKYATDAIHNNPIGPLRTVK
jgi:hypothetical protein